MSVLAYLGKGSDLPAMVKSPSGVEIALQPVVEAFRGRVEVAGPGASYKNVGDYDPVLNWHCRL